jgi:hypothetical protein
MNWDWASSLDQFWHSPTFPMWLTLATAGFFGIIVLIMVLRAEKSVANGMLAVITALAIGAAGAVTLRGLGPDSRNASGETRPPSLTAALPALSCIDDLAGDTVLAACEKALFGSAEATAAALSYAAAQITRLTAFGDAASANNNLTPELQALRGAVERDRYGLMAYVLLARDRCTPSDCAAFQSLTNRQQLVSNMDERVYDGLVMRHSASWNTPAPTAAAPVTALAPSMPTGKPTNADFPSAASTPPVNIMTPEPSTAAAPPAPRAPALANAPLPSPRPATPPTTTATAPAAPTAAKKPPAPKSSRAGPVQLAPAAPARAPAADDE